MKLLLHDSIREQHRMLGSLLAISMHDTARRLGPHLKSRHTLEMLLLDEISAMRYCKFLYVMDLQGRQITANATSHGLDTKHLGRDRSRREYMQGLSGAINFRLSNAYISTNCKRPSITAIQVIRDRDGARSGFLGADYDLRELPHTGDLYQETSMWRQLRGDPAIRSGLFRQQRVESFIDTHISDVLILMHELMTEHGVFHGKLHFSSNRATIWLTEDPLRYRLLVIEELLNPAICLAYPRRSYPEQAIVPVTDVMPVLDRLRELRLADENIYLRSGSLNIFNGMVALNFSCDGSHYMNHAEFLKKGMQFWAGISCAG